MNRLNWIETAEYALSRLRYSAYDMTKQQTLDEFITDLKTVIENTLREVNT